jgi:hypothetical protein
MENLLQKPLDLSDSGNVYFCLFSQKTGTIPSKNAEDQGIQCKIILWVSCVGMKRGLLLFGKNINYGR